MAATQPPRGTWKPEPQPEFAMQSAIKAGSLSRVLATLSKFRFALEKPAGNGLTPLAQAAQLGHAEIVKALLERGALANAVDKVSQTPLMHAAQNGHTEAVRVLIPVSDGEKVNEYRQNALMLALENKHADCVRLLVPGRDLRQESAHKETALSCAGRSMACVRALIETASEPIEWRCGAPYGLSALSEAAAAQDLEALAFLIPFSTDGSKGADLRMGWAMRAAIAKQKLASLEMLAQVAPEKAFGPAAQTATEVEHTPLNFAISVAGGRDFSAARILAPKSRSFFWLETGRNEECAIELALSDAWRKTPSGIKPELSLAVWLAQWAAGQGFPDFQKEMDRIFEHLARADVYTASEWSRADVLAQWVSEGALRRALDTSTGRQGRMGPSTPHMDARLEAFALKEAVQEAGASLDTELSEELIAKKNAQSVESSALGAARKSAGRL